MSYSADTLDLSVLPSTPLVHIDREEIIAARKALFAQLWAEAQSHNPNLPSFDTLDLEYEPVTITSEAFAVSEALILQSINDAGKKLRLADSFGSYLDHIAVTYHRSERQTIRAASDNADAILEGDSQYRERTQLAPEALADMGLTAGAYIYKIRTEFAEDIKDVYPINRGDGHVEIRVLGRSGNGAVPAPTITKIVAAFQIEEGQQSTDVLTVLSADIEEIVWDVTIYIKRGPDPSVVEALALEKLQALAASLHKINQTIHLEALTSAAHVGPVVTCKVNAPLADKIKSSTTAYFVTAINVKAEIV